MPAVVQPYVADACLLQQPGPVVLVGLLVDRPAVGLGEDEAVVLPSVGAIARTTPPGSSAIRPSREGVRGAACEPSSVKACLDAAGGTREVALPE